MEQAVEHGRGTKRSASEFPRSDTAGHRALRRYRLCGRRIALRAKCTEPTCANRGLKQRLRLRVGHRVADRSIRSEEVNPIALAGGR